MKPSPSPKLRPTAWDALVAGIVLALAVVSAVVFYGNLRSGGYVYGLIFVLG